MEKHTHKTETAGTESSKKGRRFARILSSLGIVNKNEKLRAKNDAADVLWEQKERARLDAIPAGPGLKKYDLDPKLFQYSTHQAEIESSAPPFFNTFETMLEQYKKEHSEEVDAADDDIDLFTKLMYSGSFLSRTSRELEDWLREHAPQNGYFTPEMIEEAIAGDERISVATHTADNVTTWTFSDDEGGQFSLSRPSDGLRPQTLTKPYLTIRYHPEYDPETREIVSFPRLSVNDGPDYEKDRQALKPTSPLAQALMADLQVGPMRVQQEVEFRIIPSEPAPYLRGPDTKSDFESVRAGAYVVADFPHKEGSGSNSVRENLQ